MISKEDWVTKKRHYAKICQDNIPQLSVLLKDYHGNLLKICNNQQLAHRHKYCEQWFIIMLFSGMPTLRKGGQVMNCWEYKNCPEEVFNICPAYPESGSACFKITGVKCVEGNMEFASLDEQVAHCGNCDFYALISARPERRT